MVCKNDILLTNYFANNELDEGDYVARLNPRTKKCHVCKISENSCIYKKTTIITAICKNLYYEIGDGQDKLLNLNRASEVDWDQIISRQQNNMITYIIYNELSIEEIELIINIVSDN